MAGLKLVTCLESVDALGSHAKAEALLGSAQPHQMFSEVLEHLSSMALQASQVLLLEAFVILEVATRELLIAQLTLHHDLGTIILDVLEKLGASHVLILFLVADVAAELGALVHGMLLELEQRLPDDRAVLAVSVATMRELAEVDTVAQDLVNLAKEIAALLAVRAAHIVARRGANIRLRVLRSVGCLAAVTRR